MYAAGRQLHLDRLYDCIYVLIFTYCYYNWMCSVIFQSYHTENRYLMESTLGQHAKLIDYLQTQVENPAKKKKGVRATLIIV